MVVQNNPELLLEPVDFETDIPTDVQMEPDGGATVSFDLEGFSEAEAIDGDGDDNHYANLVDKFTPTELLDIASLIEENYTADLASIGEWEDTTVEALDNLGLIMDDAIVPFEGACTAVHPLILESVVKFQSKASNEILPPKGPVKTQIYGEQTEEKEDKAVRVKEYLNYQLTKQTVEYTPETERMLFLLPLIGNGFKKKYYDPTYERIRDEFIPPERLVVNNNAASLRSAERISCLLRKSEREMREAFATGYYEEPEKLGEPSRPELRPIEIKTREIEGKSGEQQDDVYTLIEQQVYLPVDEERWFYDKDSDMSVAMNPYVVTMDQDSLAILSIRRNWSAADKNKKRLDWITHYTFVPGPGFMALGFAHLLGNLQKTLTVTMRSLVDSGQFANLQGGFKAKGMRVARPNEPISPGEWREVESAMGDIQKTLYPLPFKEPSQTLYQLLEYMNVLGQKFADSTEQVIADSTNYGPVGTTMALLEASTKFHAAVHKRLFNSQEHELKVMARINYEFMPDQTDFDIIGGTKTVFREDFDPDIVDVIPVSDPNLSSQAQRISMAETKLHFVMQAPELHNKREAFKDMYRSLDVDDIDTLLPPEDKPVPQDPISDIMGAVQGKPIAAFPGQNHEAHIKVKGNWLQDPEFGGSVIMTGAAPALEANIQEHTLMLYQEQLQALMPVGAAMDPQSQEMVLAQVSDKLTRLHQIAIEEEQEGSPAKILADAEMMNAETKRDEEIRQAAKDQFESGLKLVELSLKAEESGGKLELDVMKTAGDLIDKGAQHVEAQAAAEAKERSENKDNKEES